VVTWAVAMPTPGAASKTASKKGLKNSRRTNSLEEANEWQQCWMKTGLEMPPDRSPS